MAIILAKEDKEHRSSQPMGLLSIKEAAGFLSVSERKVYNLIYDQVLPFVKVGTRTLVDVVDILEWIEKEKQYA